jgi:hypothetical protein
VRPVVRKSIIVLGLLVITLLPQFDDRLNAFRTLVGDFAINHLGLRSASLFSLIAGVLAVLIIPSGRRGVIASSIAFCVCIAACMLAALINAGLFPIGNFIAWGEPVYVVMVISAAFGSMGLLACVLSPWSRTFSVFLSSTTQDLAEYREVASHTIQRLDGFSVIRMEDFGPRESTPIEFALRKVSECDVFVGIIGKAYGSCPPAAESSFTEIEYDCARAQRKPCLMFISEGEASLPLANEPAEKQARLHALRQRIGQECLRSTFASPDGLGKGIVEALRNWERGH